MSASRETSLRAPHLAVLHLALATLVVGVLSSCAVANPGPDHIDGLPSVELILKRYVEAVGGRETILGLTNRVATLHRITDMTWDRHIHEVDTLKIYGDSSGEFLIVTKSERGTLLEGFDGNEEWKIDPTGQVSLSTAIGPRDRWMTDPRFPLKIRDYFPEMKVLGVDVWGTDLGGADEVFVVDIDGDESHRLGFDVETGLLVRMGYNRALRDYREVDGVLMPMEVAYSRKGGSSTYYVDSVTHNERIDRTVFSLAK